MMYKGHALRDYIPHPFLLSPWLGMSRYSRTYAQMIIVFICIYHQYIPIRLIDVGSSLAKINSKPDFLPMAMPGPDYCTSPIIALT